jgi:glycosyltransferase involved in cell wall biosynthesis
VRVLQVCLPDLTFPGGVQRHTLELSHALAEAGHDITVAAPRTRLDTAAPPVLAGIDLLTFPSAGPHPYSVSVPFLRHLVTAGRYDVVHLQNFHLLPVLAAGARGRGDLVVTPHYHRTDVLTKDRGSALIAAVKRPVLVRARAIVCVSSSEADLVARDFGLLRESLDVIPNVVVTARDAPPAERSSGGPPLVLALGRLVAYKRFDLVVAAMQHLPAHRLVIVGTGPERARLEARIASLHLGGRVHVRGRVDDDELERWLDAADVLVTMSRLEAFGRVVYDALAHRRPW